MGILLATLQSDESSMSRKQRIHDVLSLALNPEWLTVENESNRHQVPDGAETHFKVMAVSPSFESLGRVARHRLVNRYLSEEFAQGLHALSLHLYTPADWVNANKKAPPSPPCQHSKQSDNREDKK